MTGVRFYLEFPTPAAKARSGRANNKHSGNVFAAFLTERGRFQGDGVGAILPEPNSCVAYTGVNIRDWLHKFCKRVPEDLARKIHPALFERLDAE
jgi:hypothetical protein